MNILVTGGSGLVGSAMKRLYPNYIYISSKDYNLENYYETKLCFEKYKPSIVIHLASIVLDSTSSDIQQFDSLIKNSKIHTNVFDCCRQYSVQKIITCLSVAMVSNTAIDQISIKDGPSIDIQNHYGYVHSKRLLHSLCISYERSKLGKCILLCPTNIYGIEDLYTSNRLIPSLFQKLLNGQNLIELPFKSERQLLFNEDCANIINEFINNEYDNNMNNIYIIGHPELISFNDILMDMKNIMDKHYIIRYNSVDCSRICELSQLPFEFKYTCFEVAFIKMYCNLSKNNKETNQEIIELGTFQTNEEINMNITDVLKSGRLTYGPYCKQMEQNFANLHNCKFAILSNSGTSSLQVGLMAMREYYKWNVGDEILVPAITFVASINTIISSNLTPVLVDVDPLYYEIDPYRITEKITNRTKAIMVVHLFGQPCDMEPILIIAKKYNLRIIEDSCETMLANYKNQSVGTFGDFAAFSTYVAHILVTGVGGILTTNNEKLAILARSLVNHGRNNIYINIDDDNKDNKRFNEIIDKRFQFERIGYSYRITELEAAIGVANINDMLTNINKRQKFAKKLNNEFIKTGLIKYFQIPQIRKETEHVFMMYPLVITSLNISKKNLIYFLESKNIETRDLMPITNQPVYKNIDDFEEKLYPVARYLNRNGFYIGCHPNLDIDKSCDYIINVIKEFINNYL